MDSVTPFIVLSSILFTIGDKPEDRTEGNS